MQHPLREESCQECAESIQIAIDSAPTNWLTPQHVIHNAMVAVILHRGNGTQPDLPSVKSIISALPSSFLHGITPELITEEYHASLERVCECVRNGALPTEETEKKKTKQKRKIHQAHPSTNGEPHGNDVPAPPEEAVIGCESLSRADSAIPEAIARAMRRGAKDWENYVHE